METDEDRDFWYRTLAVGVLVTSLTLAVATVQASPQPFSEVVARAYTYTGADKPLAQGFTVAALVLLFATPMVLFGMLGFTFFSAIVLLVWAALRAGTRLVFGPVPPHRSKQRHRSLPTQKSPGP